MCSIQGGIEGIGEDMRTYTITVELHTDKKDLIKSDIYQFFDNLNDIYKLANANANWKLIDMEES